MRGHTRCPSLARSLRDQVGGAQCRGHDRDVDQMRQCEYHPASALVHADVRIWNLINLQLVTVRSSDFSGFTVSAWELPSSLLLVAGTTICEMDGGVQISGEGAFSRRCLLRKRGKQYHGFLAIAKARPCTCDQSQRSWYCARRLRRA